MRERTKSQKDLMNEDKVLDIHTAVYDGVESYFNDESNLCNSNVNAQTTKGWTPLMVACSITDRTSIAETLLKAGADVNLINNEGWTARELAQFFKLDEIENLFKRTGGCFNGEPVTLHPSLITETIRPDWCKCGSCLPQDCKEKEVCCHQIRDKIKKKKMRRFVEKKCITTSGSFKDTSLNKTYLDTNWSKFKFGSKPCTTPEYIELACKVFKINVTGQCIEEMVVPACVLQETELKFSSEKCTHETTGYRQLNNRSLASEEEDSLDDHNSMASGEDSLDDHNSMASGEDSLDDHNRMASKAKDSLDDHNCMASKEDILKDFTCTHEVQECLEGQGEVDLHTHLAKCEKNPGHKNFIPVNKLSLEHFPSGYHNNDVYDLTKALADLTVRIAVKLTSLDRPEFVPGTKDPYPCYNTRGHNSLRTGTGRVWKVTKYTEAMDQTYKTYRTCPCPECDHSYTPSIVWWEVVVSTASHVVFDSSEARQSSCRLWFDDDKSPVVKIYGWRVSGSYNKGDRCFLYCATHDVDVGDKLNEMVWRFSYLHSKVWDKYKRRRDVDKLTIIVSHPHGCSKQVSVGHWVNRQVVDRQVVNRQVVDRQVVDRQVVDRQVVDRQVVGKYETRYMYTTCTCPGSGGALVYRLGCRWSNHIHSGGNSDGLNYSGMAFEKLL